MTERAVRDGLFEAIDRFVDAAYDEFDAVGVVRRSARGGPTAQVVNRLVKRNQLLDQYVVRPEVERYRENARTQVRTMVSAVAAGEPVAVHRDTLLANDVYHQALSPECSTADRRAIADLVVERFERAGRTVAPVVAAAEDEFWPAVRASLSEAAASDLLEANFAFSERIRPYRSALAFRTTLDLAELLDASLLGGLPTLTVDYTDESMRAIRRAEARVLQQYQRETARRYAVDESPQ